jgi:ribosomal protein S27AE
MARIAKGQPLTPPDRVPADLEAEKIELKLVKCPECGGVYHRTTPHFRADIDAAPDMLELIEPYKSWGWTGPPPDRTAGYGRIECPECGSVIAPSGKLTLVDP